MLIDSFEAGKIVKAFQEGKESVKVKLDLGFRKKEIFFKKDDILINNKFYPVETMKKLVKDHGIYDLNDEITKIAFFDQHYYKLEPIEGTAPTLEIDGIRMHRTKHMTPLEDAQRKISYIRLSEGEDVLDICTGLGYTAIHSYRKKANVTTIEKDPNVIKIAKKNPFSDELFEGISNKDIKFILDDATQVAKTFENESFDVILHDPPRFSLAGELYSGNFYEELFRILRKNGRLLHYVGSPGSKYRGKDFVKGVQNRLKNAGFRTKKTPDGESVLAFK
ncbi:MAG: methyltransferase domain-containing protein [Candidatus Heimdallarchaeota archaeon]